MKYEYLHFDGTTFKRVDKKKAKFIYNYGYVRIIPIDEVICGDPILFNDIKKRKSDILDLSFESDVQNYQYFLLTEANYSKKDSHLLFYIPIKLIDAFTGEAPAEHTINTIETYDDEFFNFYSV